MGREFKLKLLRSFSNWTPKVSKVLTQMLTIFVILTLLGLDGCLNKSRITPTYVQVETKVATQESKGLEENDHQLTRLQIEKALVRKDLDQDEALLELLMSNQGDENELFLTMEDVRFLQSQVLANQDGIRDLLNQKVTPQNDLKVNVSDRSEFSLSQVNCKRPEDTVKLVRDGKFRMIQKLHKKNEVDCFFTHSLELQSLANRLLKNQSATLKDIPTSNDGEFLSREFKSLNEFVDFLYSDESPYKVKASYRTYLAPFVRLYKSEGDAFESSTEMPLPLWIDTTLRSQSGVRIVVPAPHSEVFFALESQILPSSILRLYYSDKGFVFDTDLLFLPHWSGQKTLEVFSDEVARELLLKSADLHTAFESFKKQVSADLPLGGFGMLGVCNDGASLLLKHQNSERQFFPFPLVRSDLIKLPEDFAYKSLFESLSTDTNLEKIKDISLPERRKETLERIYQFYPYENLGQSPFTGFNDLMVEIKEELRK